MLDGTDGTARLVFESISGRRHAARLDRWIAVIRLQRAEVILGRGSSIESFPLFGYDLADYEELFEEKATLFAELLKGGPVTWEGRAAARSAVYEGGSLPGLMAVRVFAGHVVFL